MNKINLTETLYGKLESRDIIKVTIEKKWEQLFSESEDVLDRLVNEAIESLSETR